MLVSTGAFIKLRNFCFHCPRMVGTPENVTNISLILDRMSEKSNFPCAVRRVKFSLLHVNQESDYAGFWQMKVWVNGVIEAGRLPSSTATMT